MYAVGTECMNFNWQINFISSNYKCQYYTYMLIYLNSSLIFHHVWLDLSAPFYSSIRKVLLLHSDYALLYFLIYRMIGTQDKGS
jgi:hypothetical protein